MAMNSMPSFSATSLAKERPYFASYKDLISSKVCVRVEILEVLYE